MARPTIAKQPAPSFQTPQTKSPDRKDHVWVRRFNQKEEAWEWKCCLCGAVCSEPPDYPTDTGWEPDRYERLTNADRGLVPFLGRGGM